MATLIPFGLRIQASTAGLNAGLTKAQRAITSFAGSVASVSARLGGWSAAIGGLVAGGGLTLLVKRSFESIDATVKLTDRLGVATEQFIGLRYAAGLAGVDADVFGDAMEQLSRRVADAAMGAGEAGSALSQIGIQASEAAQMAPDQLFLRIADSIASIANPAQRAVVAYQLFGRQGMSLLNTLSQGSGALREQVAEAIRLGVAFNRVDAAKVEAANDSITRMRTVFEGVGNTIAIAVAPYVEALAAKITEMSSSGNIAGDVIAKAMKFVSGAIGVVLDLVDMGRLGFKALQIAALLFAQVASTAIAGLAGLAENLPEWLGGGVATNVADFAQQFSGAIGQEIARIENEMSDILVAQSNSEKVAAAFYGIESAAQKSAEAIAANAQKMVDSRGAVENATRQLDEQAEALKNLKSEAERVYEATRTPLEKYEAQIGKLSELLNAGLIDWDTYGRAVNMAREELERSADAQQRMSDLQLSDSRGQSRTGQRSSSAPNAMNALTKPAKDTATHTEQTARGVQESNRILRGIESKLVPVATEAFA